MKSKTLLVVFLFILIVFISFIYFLRGTLLISSNPSGANVYINKEFVGTTPYEAKLFKGRYEIKISKDGFEEYMANVYINGNKKESISVNLEKLQYLLLAAQKKFYKVNSEGKIVKQIGESLNGYINSVSFFPDGKKIIFGIQSTDNKKSSLWVMDIDGGNRKNLTGDMPVSSLDNVLLFPDCKKVLFTSSGSRTGFLSLWTVDIDGKNKRKVIEVEAKNRKLNCQISPDGNKILFYGYEGILQNSGPTPLWIVDSSGENLINLTKEMSGTVNFASFFPEGSKILFKFIGETSKPQLTGLWVANLDGKNMKRITKYREGYDNAIFSPKLSKDGKKIFFVSGNCLWSVNTDGTDEEIVTAGVEDFYPFPNGGKILLLEPQSGLWVINADGTGEKQITGNFFGETNYLSFGSYCITPPFSPDTRKVVLTKGLSGFYIIDLYTGKVANLNYFGLLGWLPE